MGYGSQEMAEERGRRGEVFLKAFLDERLAGTGLQVHHASEEDHNAPFDIEVLDAGRILVGIENKDLSETCQGTWVKKSAKRRKVHYAKVHHIPKLLTTVTKREGEGYIGFCEGIVNGHVTVYDFRKDELIREILAARRVGA